MKPTYTKFIALAMPLLITAGCASTTPDKHLTLAEQAATEQAIQNMDAYMAHIESQEEMLVSSEVAIAEDAVEMLSTAEIETELMQAPVLIELVVEENVEASVPAIGQPERTLFHFGFDKQTVMADDIADIKQHAQYLLQYPNLTLLINGHTDRFGPPAYNQKLSELRAQSIAEILMAQGVPAAQIQVSGLAATAPMTDPEKHNQNRRVELSYQDAMLVSK